MAGMPQEDIDALLKRLDELAPAGYSAGFRMRFANPLLARVTYREDWIRVYGDSNFILADPLVLWGLSHTGYIRWSAVRFPDPLGVLEKARDYGLNYGFTISFGPIFSRTICGFGRSDREFTEDEIALIESVAREIHDLLGNAQPLSVQQIDVLSAFSRGLDYNEICATLGISRTTLKYHLKMARKRLNVDTNIEAVQVAQMRNLLTPHPYSGRFGISGLPPGGEDASPPPDA